LNASTLGSPRPSPSTLATVSANLAEDVTHAGPRRVRNDRA
jgi:hypothetical protein